MFVRLKWQVLLQQKNWPYGLTFIITLGKELLFLPGVMINIGAIDLPYKIWSVQWVIPQLLV